MPPDGGRGDRHRPPRHAARRPAVHPRGHPVPAPAPGGARPREARAALRAVPRAALPRLARQAREPLAVRVDRRGRRVPRRGRPHRRAGGDDRLPGRHPRPHHLGQPAPARVPERRRAACPTRTGWRRAVREVPGVRAATPFVLQQALFTSPGGEAHGGLVRGVDTSRRLGGDATCSSQLRSGRLEGFAERRRGRSCSAPSWRACSACCPATP